MTHEIMLIKPEKALEIIETREPLGLAIAKDGEKYIAIDNTDGNAWTEEFYSLYVANCWLAGTMYTDEAHDVDECIQRVAETINTHNWYQDETMEKCREMAEYQIMKLREGAKRNEKTN